MQLSNDSFIVALMAQERKQNKKTPHKTTADYLFKGVNDILSMDFSQEASRESLGTDLLLPLRGVQKSTQIQKTEFLGAEMYTSRVLKSMLQRQCYVSVFLLWVVKLQHIFF